MEDNNNQTSLTRLQTSLQTEYQTAVQKFGRGYVDFLKQYPTLRKRSELINTAYDAVKEGGMSLVQIDNHFSKGASEWWIKVMLIDLFTFLGAMESVTPFQVKGIASRIRQEYYHLTPSELTYFFYSFSMGEYGKMYSGRSVNPQDILIALKEYMHHLYERRVQYDNDQRQIQLEKDKEDSRKNAVSFDKWRELRNIDKDKESPLSKIGSFTNKITSNYGTTKRAEETKSH